MNESIERKLCFVVGPIGAHGSEVRKKADTLFEYVVLPAFRERYRVERADKEMKSGLITPRIMRCLYEARLVVADLSGLNPNALYELGIVHALGKAVIHVADESTTLPFDLKDFNTLRFDPLDPENHAKLVTSMQDMDTALLADGTSTNPFTIAVTENIRPINRDEALLSTIGNVIRRLDALEATTHLSIAAQVNPKMDLGFMMRLIEYLAKNNVVFENLVLNPAIHQIELTLKGVNVAPVPGEFEGWAIHVARPPA